MSPDQVDGVAQGVGAAVGAIPPAPRRLVHLDNARALLIVLVVSAHSLNLLSTTSASAGALYRLIYLFHMPAFVFVTGYLTKPDVFTRKGLRGLAVLVWAYLLFNLLNYTWAAVGTGVALDPLRVVTTPAYALWFLLALVWWRLILPLFAIGGSRPATILSVLAAAVIAVTSGYLVPDGSWMSISRVLVFLPFFVAGYRAKQQKWSMPRTRWSRALALSAFVSVLCVLYFGGVIRNIQQLMHSSSFIQMGDVSLRAGAIRLGILLVGAVLIAAFMQLVPRRSLVFTPLGATTLSVYVWHAFALRNIRWFGLDHTILATVPALVATILAMVVIFGFGPIPRATLWVVGLARGRKRP